MTTGWLVPSAGFLVHVGGLTRRIQPFGGFHSFQNLDVGQYQVTVDVPFNCTVQAAHPSWDGMKIAFMSDRTGQRRIRTMNADGSNPVQLTTGRAEDNDPAWSPDNSRIAFERESAGQFFHIWIIDADGQNETQLTFGASESEDPKLSPDGNRIAFDSNRSGSSDIFTMNPDGTNVVRLTTDPTHEYDPAWSPDGTRIVFSSDRDGNDNLFIMDANGQNVGVSRRTAPTGTHRHGRLTACTSRSHPTATAMRTCS